MPFNIKNISNSPLSIFYIKNGKSSRITLKPGQEIDVDPVRTSQISFFERKGRIKVSQEDFVVSNVKKIIRNNALIPNKNRETLKNNIEKEEVKIKLKSIDEIIKENFVDYKKILDDNVSCIYNEIDSYDISVIIPVRNRKNFAESMYKSFLKASEKSGLKIAYTVVEHSENPDHSKFCKKNKLNYMWIKSEPDELFNKCLAHNMGAFFSVKSKYILFHDIDCLMQSDFFINLFKNIKKKKAKAIQNFTERRVLYINPELTNEVVAGNFDVDKLNIELPEVTYPRLFGAPGGSITIDRDLFFEVGGYDPELFLANSPEDAFFWAKVDVVDKMHISDDPDIELYHMYHPPTWMNNPRIYEMEAIMNSFKEMSVERKKEIIKTKAEAIKEFK